MFINFFPPTEEGTSFRCVGFIIAYGLECNMYTLICVIFWKVLQNTSLFLLLRIMMMLPLIINSYNLVSFHQNLMKLVLN